MRNHGHAPRVGIKYLFAVLKLLPHGPGGGDRSKHFALEHRQLLGTRRLHVTMMNGPSHQHSCFVLSRLSRDELLLYGVCVSQIIARWCRRLCMPWTSIKQWHKAAARPSPAPPSQNAIRYRTIVTGSVPIMTMTMCCGRLRTVSPRRYRTQWASQTAASAVVLSYPILFSPSPSCSSRRGS